MSMTKEQWQEAGEPEAVLMGGRYFVGADMSDAALHWNQPYVTPQETIIGSGPYLGYDAIPGKKSQTPTPGECRPDPMAADSESLPRVSMTIPALIAEVTRQDKEIAGLLELVGDHEATIAKLRHELLATAKGIAGWKMTVSKAKAHFIVELDAVRKQLVAKQANLDNSQRILDETQEKGERLLRDYQAAMRTVRALESDAAEVKKPGRKKAFRAGYEYRREGWDDVDEAYEEWRA